MIKEIENIITIREYLTIDQIIWLINNLENHDIDPIYIKYCFYKNPIEGTCFTQKRIMLNKIQQNIIRIILKSHSILFCRSKNLNIRKICSDICHCDERIYWDYLYIRFIYNMLEKEPYELLNNKYFIDGFVDLILMTDVIDNRLYETFKKIMLSDDCHKIEFITTIIKKCNLLGKKYLGLIQYIYGDYYDNMIKIRNNFTQIDNNIFITDKVMAANVELIKENNIDIIINMTSQYIFHIRNIRYYNMPLLDSPNENIIIKCSDLIEETKQMIENNNIILIHCSKGLSRSVAFVIMLLIRKGYTYDEAYRMIEKKRVIHINPEFIKQLKKYYQNQ